MKMNAYPLRRWLIIGLLAALFSAIIVAQSNREEETDKSNSPSVPAAEPDESQRGSPEATRSGAGILRAVSNCWLDNKPWRFMFSVKRVRRDSS